MKSKTVKNCKAFIIPNGAQALSKYDVERAQEIMDKEPKATVIPFWATMRMTDAKEMGFEFDWHNECAVQIWLTSDGEDNLTSRVSDEILDELYGTHDFDYNKCLPAFFPEHVLAGKKEGDVITLTFPTGVEVDVTLQQAGFRYRNFGTFEQVFNRVRTVPVAWPFAA